MEKSKEQFEDEDYGDDFDLEDEEEFEMIDKGNILKNC